MEAVGYTLSTANGNKLGFFFCLFVCLLVGVILSAIISTDPQKLPFLLILDAKSFTELARASVDADIHLDLHGLFISDADGNAMKQTTTKTQEDENSDYPTGLKAPGLGHSENDFTPGLGGPSL